MRILTATPAVRIEGRTGVIGFICRNFHTLISGSRTADEKCNIPVKMDRDAQFKAYVNNRMNILFMWIQLKKPKGAEKSKQHLLNFLYDMEHHFVDPYADRTIRNAYRWINAYVRGYPSVNKKDRTQMASKMIAIVFKSLSMEFPFREHICF